MAGRHRPRQPRALRAVAQPPGRAERTASRRRLPQTSARPWLPQGASRGSRSWGPRSAERAACTARTCAWRLAHAQTSGDVGRYASGQPRQNAGCEGSRRPRFLVSDTRPGKPVSPTHCQRCPMHATRNSSHTAASKRSTIPSAGPVANDFRPKKRYDADSRDPTCRGNPLLRRTGSGPSAGPVLLVDDPRSIGRLLVRWRVVNTPQLS